MKYALITGASGGLGYYLTYELLEDGYTVFCLDLEKGNLEELAKEYAGRISFCYCDVRSEKSVLEVFLYVEKHTDYLDMVINCAGVLPENSEKILEEFQIDGAKDVFNVNALGPLRVVKAALPYLKRGKEKTIVNISSEAGSMMAHADYINRYDYCMSKAALNIQSIILQRYLAEEGIKVFLFNPGWMRTRMGGQAAPLLPEKSAKSIKNLLHRHNGDCYNMQLLDYNGDVRSW